MIINFPITLGSTKSRDTTHKSWAENLSALQQSKGKFAERNGHAVTASASFRTECTFSVWSLLALQKL
uniref:Uncharacterized protein n=1 Tax=Anguilla anguilla TaxID=7936 RepID=A0A0E9V293_ANGAN